MISYALVEPFEQWLVSTESIGPKANDVPPFCDGTDLCHYKVRTFGDAMKLFVHIIRVSEHAWDVEVGACDQEEEELVVLRHRAYDEAAIATVSLSTSTGKWRLRVPVPSLICEVVQEL